MKNNNSGIYKITNIKNGKFYIGSSKHFDDRWEEHKKYLNGGYHINPKLQHSWNYHGKDSFEFSIIEHVSDESQLLIREQFYLDTFKPYIQGIGYNIGEKACGGDNFTNHPEKEEILKRITVANNTSHMHGKQHKPESIEKQKQKAIGRYSLQWYINRNGNEEGTKLYNERVEKLKNRKINYIHDNGLAGKKVGPMSDENKKKISEAKLRFKSIKNNLYNDIKEGKLTIEELSGKYLISTTTVKYHKRKL